MNFSVQVEKPSSILRKLTIRVPANMVENRFQRGLAEAQKSAKVKGFRPGMVPLPVVQQMYGADIRHQVFHNLIDEFYGQAVKEQKLRTVSAPKIETPDHKTGEGAHDHSIDEGKDLTFTATVEVVPEIELKGYTGFSLTREAVKVTDDDIEAVVKNLLDSRAELVPVSGGLVGPDGTPSSRPAKKGDFVDMRFSGGIVTDSGVEEKEGMKGQRLLEIGSDSLIPGFEDQLVGMRAGETKTFRIPFPKDFHDAEIAGKESEFTVTVNELKEKKLPELTDEWVKEMGYESVADFKSKARDYLTNERTQEVERKLKSDLLQSLIDKNPFEVPMGLVQAQTRALAQEVAGNLKQQGFNDQMVQEALGAELEGLKTRAENQVRASLLLEAVGNKENIAVDKSEVDAEIAKMAESMKAEVDKVRDYYEKNPRRLEDLEYRLREDKVVKLLFDKSKIKEGK